MSIIHDALKKVQQHMEHSSSSHSSDTIEEKIEVLPSVSNSPTKSKSPWLLMILSILIIVGSLTYAWKQLEDKYPQLLPKIRFNTPVKLPAALTQPLIKPQNTPLVQPLAKLTVAKTTSETESPISDPTANVPVMPTTLNVQGIMSAGSHNVALINNGVYEEGSVIDGIKILKISLEEITIEHGGKQETVQVRK